MKAPSVAPSPELPTDRALLSRWSQALVFRIGTGGMSSIDQLPKSRDFPAELLTNDLTAGYVLGEVLGIAALKLWRPWAEERGPVDIDPMGGPLEDLANCGHPMDRARLWVLGSFIELALRAPDRLPVLISRLDSITNDRLHTMAMDAVCGRPVTSLYAELWEGNDHV